MAEILTEHSLKYELVLDDHCTFGSNKAFRIRALKDFADVKKGDLGGYIGGYSNLSQEGTCWVYNSDLPNATPARTATLLDTAKLMEHAIIFGQATVSDGSIVCGHARIGGEAIIMNSFVDGTTQILDDAMIECVEVTGSCVIKDCADVSESTLHGKVQVLESASISKTSLLRGSITVRGLADVKASTVKGVICLDGLARLDDSDFIGSGTITDEVSLNSTTAYGEMQLSGVANFDNCDFDVNATSRVAWNFVNGLVDYRSRKFTQASLKDDKVAYVPGGLARPVDLLRRESPMRFAELATA